MPDDHPAVAVEREQRLGAMSGAQVLVRNVEREEAGVDRRRHPDERDLVARTVFVLEREPVDRPIEQVTADLGRASTLTFQRDDPERLLRQVERAATASSALPAPAEATVLGRCDVEDATLAAQLLEGNRARLARHDLRPETDRAADAHLPEIDHHRLRRPLGAEEIDDLSIEAEGRADDQGAEGGCDQHHDPAASVPPRATANVQPVRVVQRNAEPGKPIREQPIRCVDHFVTSSGSNASSSAARAWASAAATVPSLIPQAAAISA